MVLHTFYLLGASHLHSSCCIFKCNQKHWCKKTLKRYEIALLSVAMCYKITAAIPCSFCFSLHMLSGHSRVLIFFYYTFSVVSRSGWWQPYTAQ